ncbi:MAG: aminotransferase class I/II-fold pyridoxal phosphate-dependent enzyme [Erysipelotrichia bacterium]|nr:aminotransferase class I/II-fold pyridoxal phosphate-dependent enzyme [Erysipelotrichia bacterium]
MTFTRKTANLIPIEDTVFAIVSLAKKDTAEHGPECVTDATIGSLYDESGRLVAYDSVFNHYDAIDHRVKASYAASFTGNPGFRTQVYNWVVQGVKLNLAHSVIATPGGSGAVSTAITTFLDEGQTLILPEIAWGSYKLMAAENNIKSENYEIFDGNQFNFSSLRETMEKVSKTQDRLVIVVNDPCQNPTGYSMNRQEWDNMIDLLNEYGNKMPVILIDDIAYIDYSNDLAHARDYMNSFNRISDNVMLTVAFSCSKTLTSYGLRCGAAVLMAKEQKDVREAEIVFEKSARATWSNIPNAAMENFTWVVTDNKDAFLREKQNYVNLMKQRSSIFLKEASECGLETYPYKEGFFVTLRIPDNQVRHAVHQEFINQHIYTVEVNHGIRVAVCSLPLCKVSGLAKKMKQIEDNVFSR